MNLLEVTGLTVHSASGQLILDDVSWSLDAGGRLGLIGESGSGKSMTALAILGLLPEGMRASGSVRLDGVELLGMPARRLRRLRGAQVAMVFQEPLTALDPLMSIGRQIAGPLRLHHGLSKAAAAAEARRLCELVRLPDVTRVLESFPWQLSGGQRQRANLAMALACRPRVLLADEPTTALDVTVQAEILELLGDVVSQTETALVFISHDLPVVAQLVTDLVVMRHGAVLERATVDRVLSGAEHPYTRTLLDSARAITRLPEGTAR